MNIYEDTIRFNYEDMIFKTRLLRDVADRCEQEARSAETLLTALSDSWEGDSANLMKEQIQLWANDQRGYGERILAVANTIKDIVDGYKLADEARVHRT